jgi:iron-sulfur cluster assembly accessory protein
MTTDANISVSNRAANRIREIMAGAGQNALRVSVQGGGCSGFRYDFEIVSETNADDLVIEKSGARVAIDPVSVPFIAGSEIDFVDDLIGASFKITNPNATASCGCGTSFSV